MLPQPGDIVCAGLDMGLRKDSSALVIVHRRADILTVADLLELRPVDGAPLKPSHVVRSFARVMKEHGCTYAVGDNHYREAVAEYLEEFDLSFAPGPNPPSEAYVRTRALMREGRVRLPRHEKLLRQLRDTVGVVTSGGRISIQHPRNAGGHSDLVAALVLALWQVSGDTVPASAPELGTREWEEAARERRRQRRVAELAKPAWAPTKTPGRRWA
jgi:hypothetical protein